MQCDLDGVIIRRLEPFEDSRGWLIELFRQDELSEPDFPAMSYISMTRPGVARGPHEHAQQTDLFGFVGPSTFRLYLWDARPDSPTRGRAFRGEFGEKNHALVIVPPGVVHAYKNIGTVDGIVFNAPNRLYGGAGKKSPVDEIRHEDDPDSPYRLDD
jgi:dTDP-4-dehydrorhamnose 3,5-epimerase